MTEAKGTTNTEQLNNIITASGLKKSYLAGICGISRQSLSNKINNHSMFNAKEIKILCTELRIDSGQRDRIFFV